MHTLGMTVDEPRVGVASLTVDAPDGTFPARPPAGSSAIPRRYRTAKPDPAYVGAGLAALHEACVELGVPVAYVVFVREVGLPIVPVRLTEGGIEMPAFVEFLAGWFVAPHPENIWIVVDRTPPDELRARVRHEAAHLAYHRAHPDDPDGHEGLSEDFARRFAGETDPPV